MLSALNDELPTKRDGEGDALGSQKGNEARRTYSLMRNAGRGDAPVARDRCVWLRLRGTPTGPFGAVFQVPLWATDYL